MIEKIQDREKRIEKGYLDRQKLSDANKLDAAKKDLEFWESLSDVIGQPEPGNPDFELWYSCRIMGFCKSHDLGECVFYCCHDRPSMQKWKTHHKKFHSKEDKFYVRCKECKRLQDEEAKFLKNRVLDFERKLSSSVDNADNAEVSKISSDDKNPIGTDELLSTIESIVDADLDSILAEERLAEGKIGQRYVTYYERNPKLRSKAIWYHGFKCMACGFDFQEKYGNRGSRFIEVHHLKPISSLEKETIIDPKTEMAVVCSNCHRMIHRKKDQVLSLKELREIIQVK